MIFAQLTNANTFSHFIDANTLIAWDAKTFCAPSHLTPAQAVSFKVVEVVNTPQPPITRLQRLVANGAVLDNGAWRTAWTIVDFTPAEVEERKQEDLKIKILEIKAERDRREETGGTFVSGKWFHSDEKSKQKQISLMLLGQNLPAGIQWQTMDGTAILMTPALAQQIFATSVAQVSSLFEIAKTHIAAATAASDPHSYDFSTGWPATYGA